MGLLVTQSKDNILHVPFNLFLAVAIRVLSKQKIQNMERRTCSLEPLITEVVQQKLLDFFKKYFDTYDL